MSTAPTVPSQQAPRILEYDGSFVGFLCAVCELMNEARAGQDLRFLTLRRAGLPADLFDNRRIVARDEGRAAGLWSRLLGRLGEEPAKTIFEAFCSDVDGADASAARMIHRLWHEGAGALDDLGDEDARLVEKAGTRTRREAHRMLGLIRFRELRDSSLFASIDTDCDLLTLIADHFAARFPTLRWAIRDERRDAALIHEPGRGCRLGSRLEVESEAGPAGDLPVSADEERIVACWQGYFETVAIRERANPRLQASFMPKKYWKNLPEKGAPSS